MSKATELDNFLLYTNDLIESKYILADIKIVAVLKSIASSKTILALFANAMENFDYASAQKKYLVKSSYLNSDKGEYVIPQNPKDILALVFNVLMEIDSKKLSLSYFIDKYFYSDGSTIAQYNAFVNQMIVPFRDTVKILMEGIISGEIADPTLEKKEKSNDNEKRGESFGKAIKTVKTLLLADKKKIKESKLKPNEKSDLTMVVDMMANVIDSNDKDAIDYAFIAYRYAVKAHPILLKRRTKKVGNFIKDIKNGL